MRAVVLVVEDVLVPEQSSERWQWAWRPQGPILPDRHLRASIRRGLHEWDRRRWDSVTGAQPPIDAAEQRAATRRMLQEIAGRPLPEAETEAVVGRFLNGSYPRVAEPDVSAALTALRAEGWTIGAIGERPGPWAAETVRRAGLMRSVDKVLGLGANAPWLPAREAFKEAAKELGAKPKETVFVGRLYWSEVRASQRAGMTGFLLDRPDWWPRVVERRIRSLTELAPALRAPLSPPVEDPAAGPGSAPNPA